MKKRIFLLSAIVCLTTQQAVFAETTNNLLLTAGEVAMAVSGFSENEKKAIRDYYRGTRTTGGNYSSGDYDGRYPKTYKGEDESYQQEKRDLERYQSRHNESDDDSDERSSKQKKKKNKKKRKNKKGMPPGLAKRDSLPPGLQKQLEKNGTLPPGLAKRELPVELRKRLPQRPDNQEVVVVDNDVLLVETATGVIIDILRGWAWNKQ